MRLLQRQNGTLHHEFGELMERTTSQRTTRTALRMSQNKNIMIKIKPYVNKLQLILTRLEFIIILYIGLQIIIILKKLKKLKQ